MAAGEGAEGGQDGELCGEVEAGERGAGIAATADGVFGMDVAGEGEVGGVLCGFVLEAEGTAEELVVDFGVELGEEFGGGFVVVATDPVDVKLWVAGAPGLGGGEDRGSAAEGGMDPVA